MFDDVTLLLVLAILFLLAGCVIDKREEPPKPRDVTLRIHDSPPRGAETAYYVEVLGHTVFMPFAATPSSARSVRLRIVRAVEVHVRVFQKTEGISVAPATIIVTSEQRFPTV